jgi:hypothetical protein
LRSVEFHPEADAEFVAAARYYEAQAQDLGLDFISAVQRAYRRLPEFPESGQPFGGRLRRVLVGGFPTGLSTALQPTESSSSRSPTFTGGPATGELAPRWGAA